MRKPGKYYAKKQGGKLPCFCFDEVTSTSDAAKLIIHEGGAEEVFAVIAAEQSAGRGRMGRRFVSPRDKGIYLTLARRVAREGDYSPLGCFVSLAVCRFVEETFGVPCTLKWPNDVYWRDMKISGTLSECAVSGGLVGGCVIGTGVNVNQRVFTSGAPNPVSLSQVTGRDIDREELLQTLLARFAAYLGLVNSGSYDDIHRLYAASLYRREGMHAYRDATGGFMAAIERVEPDGRLVLRKADGELKEYLFKEVEHVI